MRMSVQNMFEGEALLDLACVEVSKTDGRLMRCRHEPDRAAGPDSKNVLRKEQQVVLHDSVAEPHHRPGQQHVDSWTCGAAIPKP